MIHFDTEFTDKNHYEILSEQFETGMAMANDDDAIELKIYQEGLENPGPFPNHSLCT